MELYITRQCYSIFIVLVTESLHITWKESLAGERGAMGLSVLQKWMVEGRGLGVNKTGVWITEIIETMRQYHCCSYLIYSTDKQVESNVLSPNGMFQNCLTDITIPAVIAMSLHARSFPATPLYFFPFNPCLTAAAILLHR